MENSFLFQAIIYLGAAVICVPIAKKLGLGSVLGYLIAGIVIGPYLMGFIGEEGEDIMHFAEFGVVMMLFLIGLELEPAHLWKMKTMILKVGLSQVLITALVFFGIALALGLPWHMALAIGMALSLSSTAIVLQSLKEKNLMDTLAGKHSFAVLLMQDIAVIPILALMPLLALTDLGTVSEHGSLFDGLAPWIQTLSVVAAVGVVILLGKFAVEPLLRMVSRTRLRELFSASALLIVIGIAFLMEAVGLSPALGTFLAGVILANSAFKHELEADLEPFKGLLLGLFFIAVGASINFELIFGNAAMVIGLTFGIMLLKGLVLFGIGKNAKLSLDQNLLFSIGLAQIGEFAFVVFSFTLQLGILDRGTTDLMMATTALSMTLTPIFNLMNEQLLLPRVGVKESTALPDDEIDEKNQVILVGFSHYGSTVGRFLRASGVSATILDHDADRVDLLRKMGFRVFYGDATRLDLLESAGAAEARLLISAIDSPETNLALVETLQKHFPNLELMIRSRNRADAYELMEMGVENIYREHLDTSIRMGKDALIKLGKRAHTVQRLAQNFQKYDEASLRELVKVKDDQQQYISMVRRQIEMQEQLLTGEMKRRFSVNDHAWDSEAIKKEIG
ncbi:monovalent cation:proton antiporter-2 (CPA2) family protein [Pararhodonellum marinum]|uniref:monovalent cation:proton antiporter-2 (CPA2) family protein n=1 Tax=Pararhodonellum marinum TaxID=2755358 RepID=UPI00188EA3CA|nr:monovalent cation:proton antiporter-2 (CPA2) family protein [Pararhodonellum marinum]